MSAAPLSDADIDRLVRVIAARGLMPVFERACADCYVVIEDVLSDRIFAAAVRARRQIVATLRVDPYRLSLCDIGRIIGRDQSTIATLARTAPKVTRPLLDHLADARAQLRCT